MKHINLLLCCLAFWCLGLQAAFADVTAPVASGTYTCNGDGTVQLTMTVTYTSTTFEWLDCVSFTFPTGWDFAGNPAGDAINDVGSAGNLAAFGTTGFCPGGDSDLSVLGGSPYTFIFDMTPPAGWTEADCATAGDGDAISFTWDYAGDGYGEAGASSPGTNGDPTTQTDLTDAGSTIPPPPCNAGTLVNAGPVDVCPGDFVDFAVTNDTIPTGGAYNIQFDDSMGGTGGLAGGFTLTGVTLPYNFDAGVNGVMAANNLDNLLGTWVLTGVALDDAGLDCSLTTGFTINFLDVSDPSCTVITTCEAGAVTNPGPLDLCPSETTIFEPAGDTLPTGGGYFIQFAEGAGASGGIAGGFDLTGVTTPYSFDATLNGVLPANNIPDLSGTWILTGFMLDINGAICDSTSNTMTVNFLDATDPLCNTMAMPCIDWLNPTDSTGWTNFNTSFGGAPCDDGTGCPFNELTAFEVWASEAYAMDNVVMGGTYTFSACNSTAGAGMGGQAWALEFTIISPSGNVDAFGLDMGSTCELTWTASESGSYVIVVTEAGACGTTTNTAVNNGFPAITCNSSPETACPAAPANDDCANAIALTLDVPTSGTNISATVSQAEFDAISQVGILAICSPPDGFSIENPVWFSFTANNTGNHTVALTNVNCAQSMAIYPVGDIDCTDINNSTLDGPDAVCIALGVGGDSTVVSLPAGDYYIVIDGAGGAACDFDLEVFEGPTCLEPSDLTALINIDGMSADLSWTSAVSTFNVEWGATGFAQGSGTQLVAGNPYMLTGLMPSTTYDYYVQADCGADGLSNWIGPFTFTTAPAAPICGGGFLDTGGQAGDYSNSENSTYTICPDNAGDAVMVDFISIAIESAASAGSDGTGCWDYLSIYDGADATATFLGDFCTTPDASGTGMALSAGDGFTSTDPSGCLTFVFNSDASVTQAGWEANVTCAPQNPCPAPVAGTAINMTDSSADLTWTSTETVFNVEWDTAGFAQGTGIMANGVGNPYSLTGLSSETTYEYYVCAVCPDMGTGAMTENLIITGTYDGPLSGGTPKGVELYAIDDIADLSLYGISSANNGTGPTMTPEYTFPANSVAAGTFIYITTDSTSFADFFGFNADLIDGSMSINGDDAIELYYNGAVIDVFGDVNMDGTGEAWEHLDGWAYRNNGQVTNGGTFDANNWTYSGINQLEGGMTNATTTVPFPLGSYTAPTGGGTTTSDCAGPFTFTTSFPTPSCSSGVFYDNGGTLNNYANNSSDSITICPDNPGDLVTVSFSLVDIESAASAGADGTGCWDYLSVYDGAGTAAGFLGDYCTSPDASGTGLALAAGDGFSSSDASGCLTFVFNSDASVALVGWEATVSCAPPPCPSDLGLSAATTGESSAGANDGSIDLTVAGAGTAPYTYQWDNGATTEDLTGVVAGTYCVTVTDAIGCTDNACYAVESLCSANWTYAAIVEYESGFSAADGSIDFSIFGGTAPYIYSWSNGETTEDLAGLSGNTTYTVEVTDATGCMITYDVFVGTDCAPDFAITGVVTDMEFGLMNGAVDLTVNSGNPPFTYSWSNGATSEDISGLIPGIYSVTVVDAAGCTDSFTGTVNGICSPNLSLSTNVTDETFLGQNDGTVDLVVGAGLAPFTYLWNTGANTQDLSGLGAGTYCVTVTDAMGCTGAICATVAAGCNPSLIANIDVTDESVVGVNDGSIDLSVFGGNPIYTYTWDNGATTADLSGLAGGIYCVTVTDGSGCTETACATVNTICAGSITLNAVVTDESQMTLNDGAIDLELTGGTAPYTYLWDNGQTSQDLIGLAPGEYCVVVTDALACTGNACYTVGVGCPFNLITAVQITDALGGNNGSIDLSVGNGTAPYSFVWDNGDMTEDISALGSGNYSVTVTDANGCQDAAIYMVDGVIAISDIATLTDIQLFPNPANQQAQLTLAFSKSAEVQVEVIDIIGQVLKQYQYENTMLIQQTFDLSRYAEGIYLIRIRVDGQQLTKRLVVRKY